jgi:phosphoserine phosphatase
MLAMAKHPFAINPTPELKEIASASGWKLYQPEENQARACKAGTTRLYRGAS